jgi:hypothetical protein
MAEDRRMTAAQVVDKLMGNEHADVVWCFSFVSSQRNRRF